MGPGAVAFLTQPFGFAGIQVAHVATALPLAIALRLQPLRWSRFEFTAIDECEQRSPTVQPEESPKMGKDGAHGIGAS
jgi:hypothetical protein